MSYKIVLFALVLVVIAIFSAFFGTNLLSFLPISLPEISSFLQDAAVMTSGILSFGNLFLIDNFLFYLFYALCLATFISGNIWIVWRIINIFR